MATESETKGLNKVIYHSLMKQLELEKLLHPDTYEAALRMAEEVRKNYVYYAGEDSFEPFPSMPKRPAPPTPKQ